MCAAASCVTTYSWTTIRHVYPTRTPSTFFHMASYDFDIPQTSVSGAQDNDSRLLDNSSFPSTTYVNLSSQSPSHDNHDVLPQFLPLPTPLLTDSRKSPHIPSSLAPHTSDASSSYPPPLSTPSVHSSDSNFCPAAAGSRDINLTHADLSSSLFAPPTQGVSSIVPVTHPSHVQRPSSLVDLFKRITWCVRYLSPSSAQTWVLT